MVVTTLVENKSISPEFKCKHGLSLHIKTEKYNILFDLGPNDLFIKNAQKLNIDLKNVDILVISHGHSDHGGGLEDFLKINKKAKIYIHRDAFIKHYVQILGHVYKSISLDETFKLDDRIVFTDDVYKINEELILFSKIEESKMLSVANKSLFMKKHGKYMEDDFTHEQSLIISEKDKNYLFAGCAHRGVINILEQSEKIINNPLDYVIGGFHLYNPTARKSEPKELVNGIGNYLNKTNSLFYTCHCTGEEPYIYLKSIMGEKIEYLCTGMVINI